MSRNPCVIGVASTTYRGLDTPEPLDMWQEVLQTAATDSGGKNVLSAIDLLATTYCQTTQYDDPLLRLSERLGITPRATHYQAIGGTSGQQIVNRAAEEIESGTLDVVAIASAEALGSQSAIRKRGERPKYSYRPTEKRPFPWEAPLHPAEIAHDLVSALNAFALFDSARRAHLGIALDDYREQIAEMLSPMTTLAAGNPEAWFQVERSVQEILEPTPANRMAAYPYTKLMVSMMNVDMAAAVIVASDGAANRLGVPSDRRVYVRGYGYDTDPVYIAEHREMHHSPAMRTASQRAMRTAGVGIDDIAHLDLYSCFPSSLNFACDALGIETTDSRGLTITGGLPYFGSPASGYMVHSVAAMCRRLREDPAELGLVSGVGMMNTKHVFGIYSGRPSSSSIEPGSPIAPADAVISGPDPVPISQGVTGPGSVVAYTVVHGADLAPESVILIADVDEGRSRAYAKVNDPVAAATAEAKELVGTSVAIRPQEFATPYGATVGHIAEIF